MADDKGPQVAPGIPEAPAGETMKRFARDQVEAVKIARAQAEAPSHDRRLDACYLAMRYLDDLNGGAHGSHTVASVIAIARQFDAYLGEP